MRYYAAQFRTVKVDRSFFAMTQRANSAFWTERSPAQPWREHVESAATRWPGT
ncbi:MAG: DUF72 domain-containing protein [Pigmentiphaga sp.]|nr:DUF72 domain-containing protein [Pigmentiphaga sp.]